MMTWRRRVGAARISSIFPARPALSRSRKNISLPGNNENLFFFRACLQGVIGQYFFLCASVGYSSSAHAE
jgi:hypothetical protein